MSFPPLRRRDVLPTVSVLQLLLNRSGARLAVDGIFGPKTEQAVKIFKEARHLGKIGNVDKTVWERIKANERLPVIDSIDVTNANDAGEIIDARLVGGGPVVYRGGMSNGVAQAIQDIKSAAQGKLFLVRMHGHGAPGNMGISEGTDTMIGHRAGIDLKNLKNIEADLRMLRGAFSPYGSIQLMGCNTGSSARGRTLLQKLANIWGVPVSAGVGPQLSGPTGIFRFEGAVITCCPGGKTLKAWSRSLPKFASMTPR